MYAIIARKITPIIMPTLMVMATFPALHSVHLSPAQVHAVEQTMQSGPRDPSRQSASLLATPPPDPIQMPFNGHFTTIEDTSLAL
jgi:hypothetical protein